MRVSYVTQTGDGLGVAQRMQDDGHSLQLVNLSKSDILGKGIFPTARNIRSADCEMLVMDGVGYGKIADQLTVRMKVFGSCSIGDTLTTNKPYAQQVMSSLGLPTLKPLSGDCERLVCGAWWDGFAFHYPFAAMQTDKFMAGELGQTVSSGDSVLFPLPTHSPLFKFLAKTKRFLKTSSYRGTVFLTFLLKESFVCVDDVSICFKHPLVSCFFVLTGFKPTKFFSSLHTGIDVAKYEYRNKYAIGITLSVPPYPHARNGHKRPSSIGGVVQANAKHIWMSDVCVDGEGKLFTAGASGRVLVATARGKDMRECRRRAYITLNNIHVDDKQYRIDIGTLWWENKLQKIKDWGYV